MFVLHYRKIIKQTIRIYFEILHRMKVTSITIKDVEYNAWHQGASGEIGTKRIPNGKE